MMSTSYSTSASGDTATPTKDDLRDIRSLPLEVSKLIAEAKLRPRRQLSSSQDPLEEDSSPRYYPEPTESFLCLKQWEGVVTELRQTEFLADLYEVGRIADGPTEVGEFDISDVPPRDIDLLALGAPFRYLIVRRVKSHGQRDTMYMIRFRRLPVPMREDLQRREERALKLQEAINWD